MLQTTSNFLSFRCGRQAFCCQQWDIFLTRDLVERFSRDYKQIFPDLSNPSECFTLLKPSHPIYYAKSKLKEGRCIFLDEKKECRLFNFYGIPEGNPLCIVFPFFKIKLPHQTVLTTTLSCSSEIRKLGDPLYHPITLKDDHPAHSWFYTDFSTLATVPFHSTKKFSWNDFESLQNDLFSLLKNNNPWNLRLQLSQNQKNIYASSISEKGSLLPLFSFLQRKINLYHQDSFEKRVAPLLQMHPTSPWGQDHLSFENELIKWNSFFSNYCLLKIFYNPLQFTRGIEYFWHVLLFCLLYIKMELFLSWKNHGKLTLERVSEIVQWTEKNFHHDARLFEFWGEGRRRNQDFFPGSLDRFIL